MYIPQPTIFLHHVKSYTTDLLVDHEYDVKPVQRTTIIMCKTNAQTWGKYLAQMPEVLQ